MKKYLLIFLAFFLTLTITAFASDAIADDDTPEVAVEDVIDDDDCDDEEDSDEDAVRAMPIAKGGPSAPETSLREIMPSAVFHGCVDAMSGDYIENHEDIAIAGIVPFAMTRSYQHTNYQFTEDPLRRYSIAAGWNHDFYSAIFAEREKKHKNRKNSKKTDHYYAFVRSPGGFVCTL